MRRYILFYVLSPPLLLSKKRFHTTKDKETVQSQDTARAPTQAEFLQLCSIGT